jgi:hypothetical protein
MDIDNLGISYAIGEDGAPHLTVPDGMRDFVVNFIRTTAVKTPAEIAAVAQEGQDNILRGLAGLSDAQAQYKPAAGDWAILDATAHIVTVKRLMPVLCNALAQGALPPGFGPQLEEERAQDGVTAASFTSVAEARDAAEAAHLDMLAFIERMDQAQTGLRFSHYFFGSMNAREWACFYRVHDGDHGPHLMKIRQSHGFPAS